MKICKGCGRHPVGATRRVYCDECGPRASAIWKCRHRREFSEKWRAGDRVGPPPWLDNWSSIESRRTYQREYMRRWRAMLRLRNCDARSSSQVEERPDEAADS
jgi:hypothetical protein